MIQRSYDDSASLYLIPTPIGNLEDMTIRAINTLKSVEVIFSEDTRVTINLLNHYEIKNKVIALHEHNEEKITAKVIEYLEAGKSVGLVTDRGTPIISDPGYKCSVAVINAGYNVISLPGATALIPALTVSSIEPAPFVFYGFLNSKSSKQKQELELLKDNKYTMIFYEAPHRIIDTLNNMSEVLGNRHVGISREISKKFESVYRGTISEVIPHLEQAKGEFVIVVEGNKEIKAAMDPMEELEMLIEQGMSSKEAIKLVAHKHNTLKNEIYQNYLKRKNG